MVARDGKRDTCAPLAARGRTGLGEGRRRRTLSANLRGGTCLLARRAPSQRAGPSGPASPQPRSRRGARAPRTAAGRLGEGCGHPGTRAAGQGTGWETDRPRRRARCGGRGALGMTSLDSSGSAVLGILWKAQRRHSAGSELLSAQENGPLQTTPLGKPPIRGPSRRRSGLASAAASLPRPVSCVPPSSSGGCSPPHRVIGPSCKAAGSPAGSGNEDADLELEQGDAGPRKSVKWLWGPPGWAAPASRGAGEERF